jgi:PAS domain S-box-containing protein
VSAKLQQRPRADALPAPLDLSVFRQMADMSNDAFYLADARGRFRYVNERATTLTGYSRSELLRMTMFDLDPEYPRDQFAAIVEMLAHGPLPPIEARTRRKDGSIHPSEASVARIDVGGETYLFGVVRDISERKQMEEAQRTFARRLLQTLEAERQRVARELHDDVGQAIATVGVLLHALEQTEGAISDETRPALAAAHATIRQITESVARIVRDYHPADLLALGLEDTLRAHARQFAHRHGLTLRLATVSVDGLLDDERALHVYRIVQEALANVGRHAHAHRVVVRLARERQRVVVSIRDDGVGFSPARVRGAGLGLVTMRERAGLMGAELTLRSAPRRGTELRVAVPVVATQASVPAAGYANEERGAPRP